MVALRRLPPSPIRLYRIESRGSESHQPRSCPGAHDSPDSPLATTAAIAQNGWVPPDQSQPEGELVTASLGKSRLENADHMNRVRLFFAMAMAGLYAYALWIVRDRGLEPTTPHMVAYGVGSIALWLGSRQWRAVRNASRFAVPLFDIPVAAWIQHTNVRQAPDGETTALFTLALFVFLIAFSAFSLRPRHLLFSLGSAIACLVPVYSAAGVSPMSWVAGPVLLILTAGTMIWFPKRQAGLIREAAERQARRDRLARYFSPGVAEVIEAHDEPGAGESCELTVLFCDIRGFTGLSEKLDAPAVVDLLNEFHSAMVEEIFERGGTLDKYLGDGLLAYFNAPVRQADHATRAVACALAMVRRLETLNAGRAAAGKPPLGIGIGLHAGQAVVGNVGAPHRREFTAIGDTVNVASRLQSLTREHGTSILVSEAVVEAVPHHPTAAVHFAPAGETAVRGRDATIRLFVPTPTGA